MLTLKKYISILLLFTFFAGLVLKQLLSTLGISISGLDYMIWFFIFIQLLGFALINKKIVLPNSYFIFLIISIGFIVLNYFTTKYSKSINSYTIASVITLMFPLSFTVTYNLSFNKNEIIKLIKWFVSTITVLLVILFIERIFNGALFTGKKITSIFIKTYGFIGTISSLNIAFSLFLFKEIGNKKYIYIMLFSFFMIAHLVMLKSFVSLFVLLGVYFLFFQNKDILRKGLYIMLSLILLLVITSKVSSVNVKIEKYKKYYLNTSGEKLTPRLALYREAFHIASDHFPFGSGQGTYGSYPVMKYYSDVYKDYGLSHRQGLIFKRKPNFLFDSYWSSILGEMGYIGATFYILLFLWPLLFSLKYRNHKELKNLVFLNFGIIAIIFIESLALAIPYQVSFVVLYAGITGLICRVLYNCKI
jgi:hypothetical protein